MASSLINLSSEEVSAPKKRDEVHRAWMTRALDINDNEFQMYQLPTQQDIKEFSEHMTLKRDHNEMALLSSLQVAVYESPRLLVRNNNIIPTMRTVVITCTCRFR